MDANLKFGEIVSRCGLDKSSARYLLATGFIHSLPEGRRQGFHRLFSHEQAMDLALTTTLMGTGFELSIANWLKDHAIERALQELKQDKRPSFLFSGTTTTDRPWIIAVADMSFVTVYRKGDRTFRYWEVFGAEMPPDLKRDVSVVTVRLNLTHLEILLSRKK